MSYRAIVIACLATVSPEEHSLIIRDIPSDERAQFRIDWYGKNNNLEYNRNIRGLFSVQSGDMYLRIFYMKSEKQSLI